MSKGDLDICPACGWSCKRVWKFSNNECNPAAGKTADEFIAIVTKLPNVTAKKGGAGYGSIFVTIADTRERESKQDIDIFYRVVHGTVALDHVFWFRDDDSPAETAEFVAALANTSSKLAKKAAGLSEIEQAIGAACSNCGCFTTIDDRCVRCGRDRKVPR